MDVESKIMYKKTTIIFIIVFAFSSFISFAKTIEKSDSLPKLNREIISFVNANLGKKVGDGQCWALAAEALSAINATWDHQYKFGREIQYGKEKIFPGDIIQFNDVTIKYRQNSSLVIERYLLHTAIIYQVKEDGTYIIANQNVNNVLALKLTELNLNAVIRGKYTFFRPEE